MGFSALFSLSMLFFFSCTFGLEPLSASRKASVSVTLSGTADSGSDSGSRAIATDSGYVYLQTGITAENATLYGPYPVASGSTATITDIPAGTYPSLILFFLPELPTAPITAIHTADATVEGARVAAQKAFVANIALCSSSSIGLVSDYTIKEGEQNPITASLVPITALKPNEDNSVAVSGNAGKRASRFIRLEGIKEVFAGTDQTSKKELIMAVVNPSLVGSLEVTGIGLYDSTGTLVSRDNESVTVAVGGFKTKAVSWSGDDVYYAFVEFTGPEVQCVFSASVGVPTNLVNLYLDLNIPGNPQIIPMPVPAGTVIPLPAFPATYPGYTLLGWATTRTATTPDYNNGFGYTVGTADVTLYAVWGVAANVGVVNFHANGGTVVTAMDPISGPSATSAYLPTCTFTFAGCSFMGWATTDNALSPDYPPEALYEFGIGTVTLYAVWQEAVAPVISAVSFITATTGYTNVYSGLSLRIYCSETGTGLRTIRVNGDVYTLAGAFVQLDADILPSNVNGMDIELTSAVGVAGFITVQGITLLPSSGTKAVSVSLVDNAGNESGAASTTIQLDTIAPSASSFWIYDLDSVSNQYTNSQSVRLMLTYGEAEAGISKVVLTGFQPLSGTSISFSGTNQTILSLTSDTIILAVPMIGSGTIIIDGVNLPIGDGMKMATITLTDAAGNASMTIDTSTMLDITAPTNLFMNPTSPVFPASGTSVSTTYYTRYSSVNFSPAADDASSGVQGFNSDGSTAIMTVPGGTMLLASGTTTTIYAVDNAGNVTSTGIGITIIQDTTAPTLVPTPTSNYTDLSFQATDTGGSGVYSYTISQTPAIQSTQENSPSLLTYDPPLYSSVAFSGSATVTGLTQLSSIGYHYVQLIMYDVAGNSSTYYLERYFNGSATPTCTIK